MSESTGALTEAVFYILLSLYSPSHGYGIMQNVAKLSGGRVQLGAGTLYGALSTLVEKGWIVPQPGSKGARKKEYIITAHGHAAASQELDRLTELAANGKRIISGTAYEGVSS